MTGTNLKAFVGDPEYKRLICEVLSEQSGLPMRKSYEVLRAMDPEVLLGFYNTFCKGERQKFQDEFAPLYHEIRGDSLGPLFSPFGM